MNSTKRTSSPWKANWSRQTISHPWLIPESLLSSHQGIKNASYSESPSCSHWSHSTLHLRYLGQLTLKLVNATFLEPSLFTQTCPIGNPSSPLQPKNWHRSPSHLYWPYIPHPLSLIHWKTFTNLLTLQLTPHRYPNLSQMSSIRTSIPQFSPTTLS